MPASWAQAWRGNVSGNRWVEALTTVRTFSAHRRFICLFVSTLLLYSRTFGYIHFYAGLLRKWTSFSWIFVFKTLYGFWFSWNVDNLPASLMKNRSSVVFVMSKAIVGFVFDMNSALSFGVWHFAVMFAHTNITYESLWFHSQRDSTACRCAVSSSVPADAMADPADRWSIYQNQVWFVALCVRSKIAVARIRCCLDDANFSHKSD